MDRATEMEACADHGPAPRAGPGLGAGREEQTTAFHLGYRRWLDGFRGVAILFVLIYHFGLLPGGFLGVDVFFVLSGFLITTILVEEWQTRGSISFKQFYLRRGLRLLPAFFTLLCLVGLFSLWLNPQARANLWKEILVAGCYLSNWQWLHQISMANLGHTWSLSIEEQFYLLWPVLLWAMLRLGLPRRRILLVVGVAILAAFSWRLFLYRLHAFPREQRALTVWRLYIGLDTRADSLLVGCLVGLMAAWNLLPRSRRLAFLGGVAALVSAGALVHMVAYKCPDHSQFYEGLFTVVALMTGTIIVHMLVAPSRIGTLVLESAPLVGLGRISYSLYLYHVYVISWLGHENLGWNWLTPLAAGLSILIAIVSLFLIERPFLRLKHRLKPAAAAETPPSCPEIRPQQVAA